MTFLILRYCIGNTPHKNSQKILENNEKDKHIPATAKIFNKIKEFVEQVFEIHP